MTIDRAGLTADLALRYNLLLTEAGLAATDTEGGVGPVLVRVQTIATDQPNLVSSTIGLIARYIALDVITERLATRMDTTTPDGSFRLNQLFTNAKALRDSLGATVGWIVLGDLTSGATSQIVTISAPYLNDPHATNGEWGGRW